MDTTPQEQPNNFVRFLTNTVVILIAAGVILIVIGVTGFASKLLSSSFDTYKPSIDNILKTIGTAILGGGVFSSLVQSQRFTTVYQKVFENVLWSNDFLKRRGDIREVWNNVSRLLYQEKFPALSNEIEEIITTEYFPTSHDFYIENYDLTITLSERNEHYLEHTEFLNVILKPSKKDNNLSYLFCSNIVFPPDSTGADETDIIVGDLMVNNKKIEITDDISKKEKTDTHHIFTFDLKLSGSSEYNIVLKRTKILEKSTNKDKRFFARYFQKDTKVSILAPIGIEIAFYSMGTVNDFVKSIDQINSGLRTLKYNYNGLILPKQGFIILVN